jgi:hypothetical protein
MDVWTIGIWIAIVAGLLWVSRRAAAALGQSSDVMACLFVPPDRRLGWPMGVQESDEPWAWRSPDPELATIPDDPVRTSPVESAPVGRWRGPRSAR